MDHHSGWSKGSKELNKEERAKKKEAAMTEKSQLRVRWLVLLLSCLLMIGNYYCFDNPSALKSQLQQRFNKYPKDRYEFLFVR